MAKASGNSGHDRELAAMATILRALEPLDGESTRRVLDYVLLRLGVPGDSKAYSLGSSAAASVAPTFHETAADRGAMTLSIRDLREQKQPESSNQMAALVAFYLSEMAPGGERKNWINAADLQKYFKQAAFKLPKSISSTLPNAAAAGYLDSDGSGRYSLNPVGYNLIVHGLPRAAIREKRSKSK